MILAVPKLEIIKIYKSEDTIGGRNNLQWLNVLLKIN